VDWIRVTHIGGPTTLIEVGPWRLLTDPTFDPPGRRYAFVWVASSRKTRGPSIRVEDLPPIDAVLLSHDQHGDNLDNAGRTFLRKAGQVITTKAGARRLGGNATGLAPWQVMTLAAPGKRDIEVMATPCRHGAPGLHLLAGDVIGFALRWEGQQNGVLWISGDTVLYEGVRAVADRVHVGTMFLHLGGVHFPVTGPLRYTMRAKETAGLCRLVRPRTVVPIHYEGWSHFESGDAFAKALGQLPADSRDLVRQVPLGRPVTIDV
jgi:L-ascorbate metabolism protein UlaG (beta-lactamase superfamily)